MSFEEQVKAERAGPIQMLVIAFPTTSLHGAVLPALDRLKHAGIVRVIDMLVIRKDMDGRTLVATATDLTWEEATTLGAYLGSLAGLAAGGEEGMERGAMLGAAELADGHVFDDDDIFRLSRAVGDDMTVGLVLVQHTWATEFLDAIAESDGVELMNAWIRPESVLSIEAKARIDSGH